MHPSLRDEAATDGAPGDGRPERLRVWVERSWRQLQLEVLRDPSPSGQDDGNGNGNYNYNYNGNSNSNYTDNSNYNDNSNSNSNYNDTAATTTTTTTTAKCGGPSIEPLTMRL
ncbi:MAG TPA: hypothetical protein VHS13_05490 [Edaphobacter sp.]|nr:hypothetical protein [Edaphobacter sp.]